ncbi:MAG TPA: Coenzyme F420 hydrogenase/dehydrogenase, beta subunit C-terminal domain [bacterium]|nr:Coenzyme F420 hydrogenase/dehydrogenase, beta subunit C-terminal domain [bacterium]HPR87592.1 Coenzyme F420 hydrogenase/dehydrogenase, beta subunit C-terminal domain [bacterium]
MKTIDHTALAIAFTEQELCTRCGTCVGACPTRALTLDENAYPVLDPALCTECGLCARTCPGGRVNFLDLTELTFGHRQEANRFDGHVRTTYVGHAGDPEIRRGGAGGGVITALMWDLLQRGEVTGCIVTRIQRERPWRGEAFIARNYADLRSSQQSKYIIIPTNALLQQVREQPGPFAFAGLPCQIHGLRLLCAEEPTLKEKIRVMIGLFCASSLEPFVAREMLECHDIDPGRIKNFEFRGGTWPGRIRATLKDGRIKSLHYSNFKDGAINYLTQLYSPRRCQTCIDGASEFADISVSDAWTRDASGNYLFESHSKLLVRTPRGEEVIKAAITSGALDANDVSSNRSYQTHKLHTQKKGMNSPLRTARLRRQGRVAPVYDRPVPPATRAELLNERLESAVMALGRVHAIRLPLFKLLTSRYGILFVKIRQWRKSRKYRRK